jgi:SAM-dependent methyltransferase
MVTRSAAPAGGHPFAYDEVPYETKASEQAHPQHLAVWGHLRGLPVRLPSEARILEIGCGDGENLFAMAAYLPRATFVGFDLSAKAIARGRQRAALYGLDHVQLEQRDLVEGLGDGPPFDYVLAHGVFSWVPHPVQKALLELIAKHLAPAGLAFVSFNTRPGSHMGGALRTLLRQTHREGASATTKVRAALEMAQALAQLSASPHTFEAAMAEAAGVYFRNQVPPWRSLDDFVPYVFHDTLAETSESWTVAEFQSQLVPLGLRYVGESPWCPFRTNNFATVRQWLGADAIGSDEEALAMASDLHGTPFWGAVLARDDAALTSIDPSRLMGLLGSFRGQKQVSETQDEVYVAAPASNDGQEHSPALVPTSAESRLLFQLLDERAPRYVPLTLDATEGTFHPSKAVAPGLEIETPVAKDLWEAACRGLLRLAVEPYPCTLQMPGKPAVPLFIRHRCLEALAAGQPDVDLVTAYHRNVVVNAMDAAVLAEMDGTSTLKEIAGRLRPKLHARAFHLPPKLRDIVDAPLSAVESLVETLAEGHLYLGFLLEGTP